MLARSDVDVAVLETARGGIVLRGVGYESNEASVLTNVSSDHLDLQGIHTLPELAEVKATICRITRPDGWAVLNADDPLVAAVARRVRAQVAFFTLETASPRVRRHLAAGGRAYGVGDGRLVEMNGDADLDDRADRGRADRDRRHRPPQRRQRPGGGRRGARPRGDGRAGRRRAARTSGRPPIARRAGSTCSGSATGSSSSTSPTTRRGSRRSSTSPRASPAGQPVGRRRSR